MNLRINKNEECLWILSFDNIFRNDWICLHMSPTSRTPRKTHVAHVLLISASPRPEGAQLRVSTGRNTWYAKPWNHPGGSPRGAVAPRTPSRARSRSVLNKEQGQTPLLAEHDRDSGLALLRAFRVKSTSLSASSPPALSYARAIKQLTFLIDSS